MTNGSESDIPKYWFAAKRYGWGWGMPLTWQGWVVLAGFVALTAIGVICLLPSRPQDFVLWSAILALILIAICWHKGEPPRWRWGGD